MSEAVARMSVSHLLKESRKRAGLSQGQLGRILAMDQGHISKVERGLASTSIDMIDRWLEACDSRFILAPLLRATEADIQGLVGLRHRLILELSRVLIVIPDDLVEDLYARIQYWRGRYSGTPSSSTPTTQDSTVSDDPDSSRKSS